MLLLSILLLFLSADGNVIEVSALSSLDVDKFWQITDMHLDLNYSEYGDTNMNCHPSNISSNVSIGHFGNFSCDSPWALINTSIQAMKIIEPSPNFILWTGDSIAHVKPSELDWVKVYSTIEKITSLLLETFPTSKIIPIVGNHDSYPANDFPADNVKQRYQGYLTKAGWEQLIPPEGVSTFRLGGYYGYYVSQNLQVLVLNTNLYLSYNTERSNETDPTGQFAWLEKRLKQAQETNTKVIITGHVPPGYFERMPIIPFMAAPFNDVYVNLLLKYPDVILTQIYGHTHADSFRLISSDSTNGTDSPVTHAFIAPSVTPWKVPLTKMNGINPSIRLYKYAPDLALMLDYDQYFLNITKSNQERSASISTTQNKDFQSVQDQKQQNGNESSKTTLKWELLYKISELYNVGNLSLSSIENMYNVIKNNDTFFQYYYKMNTAGVPSVPCDNYCHQEHICSIRWITTSTVYKCLVSLKKPAKEFIPENAQNNTSPIYPSTSVAPTREKHHKHHYQKEMLYIITGLALGLFISLIVVVIFLTRRNACRARSDFRYSRF